MIFKLSITNKVNIIEEALVDNSLWVNGNVLYRNLIITTGAASTFSLLMIYSMQITVLDVDNLTYPKLT